MRAPLAALLLVAGCAHSSPPKSSMTSWPTLDATLLTEAAETYNFRLGRPTALAATPDGAVLFRRTGARDFAADLYELDTKTGAVKTLLAAKEALGAADENLSEAEKARRERSRTATRGVVDIGVSADGATVMVPLGERIFVLDRKTGARRAIDPQGDAYDPRLSPDGKHIAFVRDGDLWITSAVAQAPAKRLTNHGEDVEYGVADFAAQEELGRGRGYWWSPSSTEIVFQRTNTKAMDTLYVADARHPDKKPVPFKYPRAGRPNASLDLGIVGIAGGEPRWLAWDGTRYPYLARVTWTAKSPLTIVVLTREQTDLEVLAFDDKGAARTLVHEHDDAWLNVPDTRAAMGYGPGDPLWLPDGSGFLWATEAHDDGWTLELRKPDGSVARRVVEASLGMRLLVGFDGTSVIVDASTDPIRSQVLRVPLDGGKATRLDTGDGVSSGSFENGVLVVTTHLATTGGARAVAIGKDGTAHELPSVAAKPSVTPTRVLETVQIEGRTHHVAITRPRTFDKSRRYPVILKVYGGPHSQYVDAGLDSYVLDQWYADAGFVVVRSDGRGTPYRGRAWERVILKDLISIPLADQVAALQAMGKAHPEMDMTRVGVTGWSFGGYFSALAVLLRPDVFHAAVAGAPVTDWRLYDTCYTERYMREPRNNEAGYDSTSALTHAAKLSRPLLVMHGITDDNVHFAHTLALIEKLYVAGKRAEVITLSSTHMVPDPKLAFAKEQVQVEFFQQHLK